MVQSTALIVFLIDIQTETGQLLNIVRLERDIRHLRDSSQYLMKVIRPLFFIVMVYFFGVSHESPPFDTIGWDVIYIHMQ